jgi:tetratricopeptide (TPR) repeat protein
VVAVDKPDPAKLPTVDPKPVPEPAPKPVDLKPPVDPEALKAFEGGKKRLAAGEFKKAAKAFDYANTMGITEAKELLDKAREESNAEDLLNEGTKRFKAKEFARAHEALEQIPESSSFSARAKAVLALLKAEEDKRAKIDEAAKAKEDAAKAKAASEVKEKTEEALNTGMALMGEKKYAQAADYLEKVVAGDPGNARAYMVLGNCYAKSQQYDKGAAAYEEFVHLAPSDPQAPQATAILKDYFKKTNTKPKYPLP